MTHGIYKLASVGGLTLFITPAYADVSYEGKYITLIVILGILFLPVIFVALTHRVRKKLYFTSLILYAAMACAALWYINPSQNKFIFALLVPYIILVIYILKEKKVA